MKAELFDDLESICWDNFDLKLNGVSRELVVIVNIASYRPVHYGHIGLLKDARELITKSSDVRKVVAGLLVPRRANKYHDGVYKSLVCTDPDDFRSTIEECKQQNWIAAVREDVEIPETNETKSKHDVIESLRASIAQSLRNHIQACGDGNNERINVVIVDGDNKDVKAPDSIRFCEDEWDEDREMSMFPPGLTISRNLDSEEEFVSEFAIRSKLRRGLVESIRDWVSPSVLWKLEQAMEKCYCAIQVSEPMAKTSDEKVAGERTMMIDEVSIRVVSFEGSCDNQSKVEREFSGFDRVFSSQNVASAIDDLSDRACASLREGVNFTTLLWGETGTGKNDIAFGECAEDIEVGKPSCHYGSACCLIDKLVANKPASARVEISLVEYNCNGLRDLLRGGGEAKFIHKPHLQDIDSSQLLLARYIVVDTWQEAAKALKNGIREQKRWLGKNGYVYYPFSPNDSTYFVNVKYYEDTRVSEASTECVSAFTCVLLAGGERRQKTGVTEHALEGCKTVGKSLGALHDCLRASSDGNLFVPVRNSPVTMLLKSSFLKNNDRFTIIGSVFNNNGQHDISTTLSTARLMKIVKNMYSRPCREYQKDWGHRIVDYLENYVSTRKGVGEVDCNDDLAQCPDSMKMTPHLATCWMDAHVGAEEARLWDMKAEWSTRRAASVRWIEGGSYL